MFREISRRIALQFTLFVFGLLLVNGIVFLLVDIGNSRREARNTLVRTADVVRREADRALRGEQAALPKMLRERIRIFNASGASIHTGALFREAPFLPQEGLSVLHDDEERYVVLTLRVGPPERPAGFVQVANPEGIGFAGLPVRALLYLLVSILISLLTYGVGRLFAHTSLLPAEQSMHQLEQFTQDASHELRTPLTALNSSLDLALKSGRYKEGIESAKDDLHRTADLLERLLQIARLGTAGVERAAVNLSAVAASVAGSFSPLAAEQGIALTPTIAGNVRVQGDEALLRQVIANLLQNAIKFSRTGGTIRLALTKDRLSIEDNGIGIAAEALPHIFDRFYQEDASRSRGGHGLGLALVKRIVDLHGWSIDAESAAGKGTTFIVRFKR